MELEQWVEINKWIYYDGEVQHIPYISKTPENAWETIVVGSNGVFTIDTSKWENLKKYDTPIGPLQVEIDYHQRKVDSLIKDLDNIKLVWTK